MSVTLAILSIGAVIFLLRVLMALLTEWMSLPPRAQRVQVAKVNPSRRRAEVREVNPVQRRKTSTGNRERKAI